MIVIVVSFSSSHKCGGTPCCALTVLFGSSSTGCRMAGRFEELRPRVVYAIGRSALIAGSRREPAQQVGRPAGQHDEDEQP
ncbi:hypothetical protein [Nonomuraea jabiensis]|uniref:hypothetical protein n=1 Tax=Nonomuraea jabiensis TaxID=882448 RepID=UPI0036B58BA6